MFAGRFRIQSLVGVGGMGRVYRARHEVLRRVVAIKVLRKGLLTEPTVLRRFHREARAACRMEHPNVAYIIDFGHSEEGEPYLAMEFVEGPTLSAVMDQAGPLPVARMVRIWHQMALAMEAAHACDVIHRDLKPLNVILTTHRGEADQVKVLDFGLAKIIGPDATTNLTLESSTFGTPEYASPEQITEAPVDVRTDIYSFGVVGFKMLAGRPPYEGKTLEVMRGHVEGEIPRLQEVSGRADVPPALERIISRCLAKRPEDRFQSAGEIVTGLNGLSD